MTTTDKKDNKKRIIAWISLVILTICLLALNYVKFFKAPNDHIEERPVNNSSEQAIETALKDIVKNFNNNEELEDYSSQNIQMKATLNQHSIFISYITDSTTTYEFSYSNLNLNITIDKDEKNLEKFNRVYSLLLKAIQKRINNEDNIDHIVDEIVNQNQRYDGIITEENDKTYSYQINITKRLIENNIERNEEINKEDNVENNLEDNTENNNETQ